jgi:hypothetical protein
MVVFALNYDLLLYCLWIHMEMGMWFSYGLCIVKVLGDVEEIEGFVLCF